MIKRPDLLHQIQKATRRSRVVVLVGPRQCGKTTLAREFLSSEEKNYFDLEDPDDLLRLEDPKAELSALKGLVVIDEIQRKPELFPLLRVLSDRKPLPAKFLILGSASPALLKQSSESLAGRVEMIHMSGFSLEEISDKKLKTHWFRGGFPQSFLARSDESSFVWRKQFIQTFLERDVPQMGVNVPAPMLRRFWAMLAHSHAQVWNAADPAASLGVSQPTVRKYLDYLDHLLMVRELQPWHENLGKRQVKAPKIYVRDSGLLHLLLGIRSKEEFRDHPKRGVSWEGYVIEELFKKFQPDDAYFWATHNRAELDLLFLKNGKKIGFEVKLSDRPSLMPSMRIAVRDLKLEKLYVVYPGKENYDLDYRIQTISILDLEKINLR
ncbi:MAG: ATP-binding protein [Candidatus Omnitrophica bacterium]|nr:ATP-binding protein [Candidatus Omnitrophota bacterium]